MTALGCMRLGSNHGAIVAWLFVLTIGQPVVAQPAGVLTLKNGARLGPGMRGETATISKNPMQRGQAQNDAIALVDDDLRITYVNRGQIDAANSLDSVNSVLEEIELPSKNEAARGSGSLAILGVLGVTEFNRHGRRIYSIETPRGREDILQGITKITPLYAQVQTLRPYIAWDQRIATSSIRPDKLREILHHELDLTHSAGWMRMYRFYLQAERYSEARAELIEALAKFPELEEQKRLLVGLDQALADQMFREIELRRRSGQHQLVSQLLQQFPMDAGGAVIETQLKVQEQIDDLKNRVTQISDAVKALQQQVSELPAADAEAVRPVIEQITAEISIESSVRLNDFLRFRAESSIPVDQKISFAIGGWLLGAGAGLDNFEVAKSVVRVSALVKEYLSEATAARRAEILEALAKEEGGQPETVGKIIAAMKPPLPLPTPDEASGLRRISVPIGEGSDAKFVTYSLQLPPEYNPYRRYPCVVALPGLGTAVDMEINWWCGAFNAQRGERYGAASRYGYIVVVPEWMTPDQIQYNYSEGEHDRVLRCVRDALRRCSIDTDRVFISGHFDGAAAAWDIALSHPDLWAGAIMLSPSAEKFILAYTENAVNVPTYTVWGEWDGTSFMKSLGLTVDKYLSSPKYDAIGVEYRGRPRDHFLEEIPRIVDWMELTSHRRLRDRKEIDCVTSRAGDRFFYWLEIPEIDPKFVVSPVQFEMKSSKIEANIAVNSNSIRLSKYPGRQAWIWLSPDLVDFTRPVEVTNKSNSRTRSTVTADNKVLLEDVRTRGDRQAPFYAKIEVR